jgi:thymidylate synthase (FAD)
MVDKVVLRSDMKCDLIQAAGSDHMVAAIARVSTLGSRIEEYIREHGKDTTGLLDFLVRDRHGSPLEHALMTFYIETPLFVVQEMLRHRVGFSYSQESARYRELKPVFWVPAEGRKLHQVGKASKYRYMAGTKPQAAKTLDIKRRAYEASWAAYKEELANIDPDGLSPEDLMTVKEGEKIIYAKEVARSNLAHGIYTSIVVSCNPRSLMHFLELRTKDARAKRPSNPQREINDVADHMEAHFAKLFPVIHKAFNEHGRVCP